MADQSKLSLDRPSITTDSSAPLSPLDREISLRFGYLKHTVLENKYVPWNPNPKQAEFLTEHCPEMLYGGAAGGGKSVALLMGALQFVDVPNYAALLLRRTFADLNLPDALIPLSHQWLQGTDAKWDSQKHQWKFGNGALVQFGYLETEVDKYRYQGAAFSYVGFDELTQFTESQYRYLFSRLRKRLNVNVPLRMRAASNPGGIGHEWVKLRFIQRADADDRKFVSARLEDNPQLDAAAYHESLAQLDPVTRAQLRNGDWDVRPEGNMFKRAWIGVDVPPASFKRTVRAWDLAATEASVGKDPDYTVGAKLGLDHNGTVWILDIVRMRATPREVERVIKQTAMLDGVGVSIRIEQEPGSSGKSLVDHYNRDVLTGFDCRGVPATGDKVTRANPFSAACEQGRVKIAAAKWAGEFLDELCAFPEVNHDDQVDAAVGSFSNLTTAFTLNMSSSFSVGSVKA